MKLNKGHVILSIPIIIALAAIIFLAIDGVTEEENYLTGLVETTEIDIASKIPGRIDSMFVKEGDLVTKGEVIAKLESKELDAKVEQARGVKEAAYNKMILVKKGAREEQKRAVEKLYNQAKHQFDYVSKTYERFSKLYADSVISLQRKDEIEFKYNAAREQMEAAKAKYDMVMNGARKEEISAVEALYHQAENAYNEAMAYYQELSLQAPIAGEVSKLIADPGEIIASGYPVISILDKKDTKVILQVREDNLAQFEMGKEFKGIVRALGNKDFTFKVNYISPLGDFASWKPTNQKGDFDLKTFEVHLVSERPIEGLRSGMTVNIELR